MSPCSQVCTEALGLSEDTELVSRIVLETEVRSADVLETQRCWTPGSEEHGVTGSLSQLMMMESKLAW